jgi:hypothetical protein
LLSPRASALLASAEPATPAGRHRLLERAERCSAARRKLPDAIDLKAHIARQIVGAFSVAYTARAMSQSRIEKTIAKLRDGALPACSLAMRALMAGGAGKECSGCDETISRFERAYYVHLAEGEGLRFHLVCHETWVRFKRPPAAV